ncbi:MAG: hypothetical protein R2747_24235 [Pyrinomonadaceae bacterium]
MTHQIKTIVREIEEKLKETRSERAMLVGVSGIDGSGKGFITARLMEDLKRKGVNAVGINIDGWLNLPHIRFDPADPARNFYRNAIRFGEMFEKLIRPLKQNRSIRLIADFAEETADRFRRHEYFYRDADVILLEGIYLFKKDFLSIFDLKVWVECSFETALERAVARAQEGLPPEETVKAYRSIYFPAQEIHFARDNPRSAADLIFNNDLP